MAKSDEETEQAKLSHARFRLSVPALADDVVYDRWCRVGCISAPRSLQQVSLLRHLHDRIFFPICNQCFHQTITHGAVGCWVAGCSCGLSRGTLVERSTTLAVREAGTCSAE